MTIADVAREYFDAWNRRDPAQVSAMFMAGGSYLSPTSESELKGAALAAYVERTFATFPDLRFEVTRVAQTSHDAVGVEWIMRGTNDGPFADNPPTGRKVNLPGVDFIAVEDGKIRSLRAYFDRQQLAEQLGLQVIVQPVAVGQLKLGTGIYLPSGRTTKPGAYSIIWIEGRTKEEFEFIVKTYSNQIMHEMAALPGYLGMKVTVIGTRASATVAWEKPEDIQLLFGEGSTHRLAHDKFLGEDVGFALHTSVWIPHHINAIWVRCAVCDKVADYYKSSGKCPENHELPEPPHYW